MESAHQVLNKRQVIHGSLHIDSQQTAVPPLAFDNEVTKPAVSGSAGGGSVACMCSHRWGRQNIVGPLSFCFLFLYFLYLILFPTLSSFFALTNFPRNKENCREKELKVNSSDELRRGSLLHAGFYDLILFFSSIFLQFKLRPLCLRPQPLWTLNTTFFISRDQPRP